MAGARVDREQVSGHDVTEEFVDTEARSKALAATIDQLLTLLERAKTVEETLHVQRELSRLQQQQEAHKARLRYLRETTALSRVDFDLYVTPPPPPPPPTPPGWSPLTTLGQALRTLLRLCRATIDALIFVLVFALVPVVLLAVVSAARVATRARSAASPVPTHVQPDSASSYEPK